MKSAIKIFAVAATTLVSMTSFAANLSVSCHDIKTKITATTSPLLSFSVADNASNRLVGDIVENRSGNDFEFLPATSVSQYKVQTLELLLETDDESSAGNTVAQLQALYTPKKSGEKARYTGVYKRSDAGRKLQVLVTCIVK